jgi:hypothetical protein
VARLTHSPVALVAPGSAAHHACIDLRVPGVCMQCTKCSSPNVESLSHYWMSLPAESPLRVR